MPGPIVEAPPANLTTKGNPSAPVVRSLIQTLQREVLKEKLYSALDKMQADINKIYEALFDGPLPAVDGYNLTRINAAALNGPIPDSYNLAYTDRVNSFTRGQEMVEDNDEEPFWKFGFGDLNADPVEDPTSWLRIGSLADEEFYLTQNLFYESGWDRDNGSLGASLLQFIDGEVSYSFWDTALSDLRIGYIFSGKEIKTENFDQDAILGVLNIDPADVIQVATTPDLTGGQAGWFAIPNVNSTDVPASGNALADGIILIDKTNNRLVFYANGLRYRVNGTAF